MNILFSCIGRRGYIAEYFRKYLAANDRIIGTSNSRWTSGFRFCDLGVLLPDIFSSDYIPSLITLCREQNVRALLSFADPDINIISQHLDEFYAIGVLPVIPSPEVNDICFDKYRTYLFFKDYGFHTPETYVDIEKALRAIDTDKLVFPVVVKPRCGSASHHLFKARNLQELDVFFHYAPDMLIQETIAGQEYGFDICNDLQGQVVSVVPRRKLSMRSGETDRAETCSDRNLIDLGLRLGEKLGHIGPLDVDFIVQGGRAFILELNPRFGGGYPLSHLAGADFPLSILKMIQGEKIVPRIGQFFSGVIMMKEYSIWGGKITDIAGNILDMSGKEEKIVAINSIPRFEDLQLPKE